ncbi:MAG: ROK family protein [Elusimicrobiales bacterium]
MDIVGADLGGTNFRAGLVRDGKTIKTAVKAINAAAGQDELLSDFFALTDSVITPQARGIGVGVPTIVDTERGIIYETVNIPAWKDVPLKKLLEERYKIPARINNDANCFAAGEKYFGKAREFKSAVGMVMGTGLGAGLIIDGRLYNGRNCGAGEFGEIAYLDKNYEHYCSGKFFKAKGTTGKEAFAKAACGDKAALELFEEFGSHVGEAVKTVMLAVDPEIIVFGGSVSAAFGFFEPALRKSLQSFSYKRSAENLKIAVSETADMAILGAAALIFNAKEC